MNSFLISLIFFTRISIRRELDFSDKEIEKSMKLIPIVGMIIGAILCIIKYIMEYLGLYGNIYGIILFTVYIFLTGGIHIDGFTDTIDGIYSNRDRDRTLEIMQDSRIGVFGALGLIILSAFYISVFKEIQYILLFVFPIVSRTIIIYTCAKFKYAKKDGMGKKFMDFADKRIFYVFFLILLILIAYNNIYISISIILSFLFTELWIKKISRKLDGITGDILGFSIEISQILLLIIFIIIERM
ncbi:MAG: adenosylcobinamide-GDP ribazoletransferase [Andreesenia angusta]|nr:adenosylcobinamide-GDP ribazoletransferase [Andreesenia angusta]